MKSITAILAIATALLATASADEQNPSTLKEAFANHFRIGFAVGTRQLLGQHEPTLNIIAAQANTITPENLLKWDLVHPGPNEYTFEAADKFVNFGEDHEMFIVGHTLIWHIESADWIFRDAAGRPLGREALLARMRDHIHTVVGRYRGRIHAWDVVNEAFEDDGSPRDTRWRQSIGDDYIEHAFRYAHEADPNAKLYYNDYSTFLPAKRDAIIKLVERLRAANVRIDGLGLQGHWSLDYPPMSELETALEKYSKLDLPLMITELDVDVLPWPEGGVAGGADLTLRAESRAELDPFVESFPDNMQRKLADKYVDYFQLFLKYRHCIDRVTFWGVDDGQTWHNRWPIRGRTAHSLLYDRQFQPKPAFWAVLKAANAN